MQAAEPPKRATPKVLETMRRSRMWRLVTTGVNYDIHKVSWLAVQQLPALVCNCTAAARGGEQLLPM